MKRTIDYFINRTIDKNIFSVCDNGTGFVIGSIENSGRYYKTTDGMLYSTIKAAALFVWQNRKQTRKPEEQKAFNNKYQKSLF